MKTRREALKAGGIALAGGVAVVTLGPVSALSADNPITVPILGMIHEMRNPEPGSGITHDAWLELQKYADRLERLIGGAS